MDKLSYPVSKHLKEKLKAPEFKKLYDSSAIKFKIGAQLIKYRIKHKLTQEQLGHKVGVTQQQISKIEDGDFSNFSTSEKVLRAIKCRLDVKAVPEGRQTIDLYHSYLEGEMYVVDKIIYLTSAPKSVPDKSFAKLSRFSSFKDDQEKNLRITKNRTYPWFSRRKQPELVLT